MSAALARLGVNFGEQGPNFGPTNLAPRWRNVAPTWTHLGATSAQVEVHMASKWWTQPAQYEILKMLAFTGIFNILKQCSP